MPRLRFSLIPLVALAAVAMTAACSSNGSSTTATSAVSAQPDAAKLYDPQALPTGEVGASIRLGHDIMVDTHKYLPKDAVADMSCAACHIAAGTVKRGGSFVGTYARFPQWNKRSKRVIMLQDRLAECFLYSMNGTPPAYNSKEMIAMTAYIAYLSRDVKVGAKQAADDRFIVPLPSASPDIARGQSLYAQKCAACHQANGAGIHGQFPPLWGPKSFNNGAGMAHIDRMTGFVHYNMPANAPGSLSVQDSYDIAGWVLTHDRPKFQKNRLIQASPQPASFF
ncbi:MAG TPA: c-type cytochrome [Candidatus Aquilonibacter sp.]|nr:c-type cytochrome [Candidatus Aquilonibacter sp.]